MCSPQYYAKLVFDDRKLINPKCPNQRLVARLGFIKNKVISSQSTLKLALGNDFGLHLEAAELDAEDRKEAKLAKQRREPGPRAAVVPVVAALGPVNEEAAIGQVWKSRLGTAKQTAAAHEGSVLVDKAPDAVLAPLNAEDQRM